jgi:hypothetical protein
MKRWLGLALSGLLVTSAHAVDYADAYVTGVGIVAGEDQIRFTIDKDPNAIMTTTSFTGEQLKRLVAMVLAAYTAQTPVKFVRSGESSSSSTRHYVNVLVFNAGPGYTFD